MTYQLIREISASWALVAMMIFYLLCIGWAFRPGGKGANERAKNSIFEGDEKDG